MGDWEAHISSGGWAEVNGVRSFYVRRGAGPSLLLIHGWASSSFTWRKLLGVLSERFDVVAVDLPGFGNSQPLPSRLSLEAVGAHLVGLMDGLGIGRFGVVGHSMGGVVASYLAAAFPDRVWGLALIAPGFLTAGRGERPPFVELARNRFIGRLLAGVLVNRRFVGRALRNACHYKQAVTDEMVEGYYRSVEKNPLTLIEAFNLSEGFSMEMLEKVTAPALMVWGSQDRWVPISVGYEVSRMRGWDVKTIEGAGHLPHEEKPTEVLQILSQFLTHAARQPPA